MWIKNSVGPDQLASVVQAVFRRSISYADCALFRVDVLKLQTIVAFQKGLEKHGRP